MLVFSALCAEKNYMRSEGIPAIAKKIIGVCILMSMALLTVLLSGIAFAGEDVADSNQKNVKTADYVSLEATHLDLGSVAQVLQVLAGGTVFRSKGKTEKLERGTLLFQGDSVDMGVNGRALVRLSDARDEKNQSLVTLLQGSHVTFQEAKADGPENLRDVRLTLDSGELRAQVPPSSDPVLPTFHVKLPTSQVNLKSGDVMIALVKTDGEWHSRVRMIDGRATLLTDRDVDGKPDFIDVPDHQQAEFINKEVPAGASMGLYQQLVNRGEFTAPSDVESNDLSQLLKRTDIKAAAAAEADALERARAARQANQAEHDKSVKTRGRKAAIAKLAAAKQKDINSHLCQAPGGQFNQCSWTCTGKNPKDANTCRTEISGVACLRRICRADGEWKEETRLPSSEHDLCPATGSTVHDCGTYW